MSGLIPFLIILFIFSQINRRSKQVRTNRPGQGGTAPASGADPKRERTSQAAGPGVRPAYVPAQPLVEVPHRPSDDGGMIDESDRARTDLLEGESRECDHGSLGGSMDITSHMGGDFEHAQTQVKVRVRPSRPAEPIEESRPMLSASKLNAAQMRQAVVMAEILRRPSERMRDRRWTFR